jgi:acyl carrier protein
MASNEELILASLGEIFLDTFSEGSYQFSIETHSEDIEEWDSLNQIRLLTAIEAEFDISFDIEEIEHLTGVRAMVDAIVRKQN